MMRDLLIFGAGFLAGSYFMYNKIYRYLANVCMQSINKED